jgi:hypothetical protein
MPSYQNQLFFEPQLAPTTSERCRNKRALKVLYLGTENQENYRSRQNSNSKI